MKTTVKAYWVPSPDSKYTNFGDILTPYILDRFGFNTVHTQKDESPQIYGIGSLLHTMPLSYQGHIWTTGMMYNTHMINIKNDPIAVRGKLTLKQFSNNTSETYLGDGGLILDKICKPKIKNKYKLGIFPNYIDIVNMRDNPLENFGVIKNNYEDVLLIDPRNYVEQVIKDVCSCEKIITSSLHGAVVADAYEIDCGVFCSRESDIALHRMQGSFKFRDYFSVYDIDFKNPELFLDNNTGIEECLAICKPFNKPNLNNIKDGLLKSVEKLRRI